MPNVLNGAEILLRCLKDHNVDRIFGYPGGAVLPIYDAIFQQNQIRHILARHEQGAVHAAEGYARSTGKPGIVLVTSGPGATNAVTGLANALMDSTPIICISGQVPTHMIGTDAFQEADIVGITRPCTKHNWLVKSVDDLAQIINDAFHIATQGRPGPVLIDIPKDVQFAKTSKITPKRRHHKTYNPPSHADPEQIRKAVDLIVKATRPILYSGGGIVNSGPQATQFLRQLVELGAFPITSTLMGLGAIEIENPHWLGMLGMHGSYEANMAMHQCDLMVCIGARFDDRITGRLDAFSPNSKKIHVDIDPSSISKNIHADVPLIGDCAVVLEQLLEALIPHKSSLKANRLADWKYQIDAWRRCNSFAYEKRSDIIMPQFAVERLYAATRDHDAYFTTEVGQHQMWAAQRFNRSDPRRWITSGGLGTMGYGLPAAIGAQIAHPEALVVDIAGEASVLMNMQEMSTAIQYHLPIKIFILNNEYMGMVRQWQELLHGKRYAESYTAALPDFVKLAEAYGAHGIRVSDPADLDDAIDAMIKIDKPVIFDCLVAKEANCMPMIPSGAAHNEILLDDASISNKTISDAGKIMV